MMAALESTVDGWMNWVSQAIWGLQRHWASPTAGWGGPASWELAMTRRLERQARELRRVRLLAAGRQLLLLALTQQAEATDGTAGTDYQREILHELIAALAAVDPSKADWTDG